MSKSDASYSDPALRALFRLNNHNYVVNALRRSSLMELLLLAEPTAERTYQDLLARDKVNYVAATFAKARPYYDHPLDEPGKHFLYCNKSYDFLLERKCNNYFDMIFAEPASKVLKERFSGFTRELEDAAKSQRTYSVPDPRLREELRRELDQALVPAYALFYGKYRAMSFSKNPGKYAKYTPEQVSELIKTFFDTAA